ncbi:hypothetical protein [Cellulophaga tyrosinoxydans]|uniref:KTSC domain-containing protein n=1 Tax=Cellulophaga tyrosinoxydans TaxID=504486 RepID=A0A1W1YBZ4_9FLAO|nr:hypothetical protein [Cellulophaga tyrosinoxydans]SMC33669.1 hypothetical protein SAMN05660703_0269 [Cellulophaga tyrosinoxydans]
MKKQAIYILLMLFLFDANSQPSVINQECKELRSKVSEYGVRDAALYSYQLQSSYLEFIFFYTYNDKNYIFVSFKTDLNNLYLYCDLPIKVIEQFLANPGTYGEKFNKYITPYKCDCS